MKTVSSICMREIESLAINVFGVSESTLMENAGIAVAGAVGSVARPGNSGEKTKVFVFCGSGNNGGDGFVAARHLLMELFTPEIILMREPSALRGAAYANYAAAERSGITVKIFGPGTSLAGNGVIIDALLGTGAKGNVREPCLSAIRLINNSNLPVISVDIPSGLDADTGEARPEAVKALITVTMGLAKKGLAAQRAVVYAGKVIVADIGLPAELL